MGTSYRVLIFTCFAFLLLLLPMDAYGEAEIALELVGKVHLPDEGYRLSVSGNFAYVADDNGGLQIVDISEPTNPRVIGSYLSSPDISTMSVTISGNFALIGYENYDTNQNGIKIVNISDPTNPTETGDFNTLEGGAWDMVAVGDFVYLANGGNGLVIVNISDPSHPTFEGSNNTPGYSYGVAVSGDFAYLADGLDGLRVLNISVPSYPIQVGYVETSKLAHGVDVSGSYIYVVDYSQGGPRGGLQIFNVSDPYNPIREGFTTAPRNAVDVRVNGNYAFIANGEDGVWIINISNPKKPVVATFSKIAKQARGVAVLGSYVYVSGMKNLYIFQYGPDGDGDGVLDVNDIYPDDPVEWSDTDGDGVGDNGDGFPDDPTEWADRDGDGRGDNGDAFPDDQAEWADHDSDGIGDNGDDFPSDPREWLDTDGDGIGDNSDFAPRVHQFYLLAAGGLLALTALGGLALLVHAAMTHYDLVQRRQIGAELKSLVVHARHRVLSGGGGQTAEAGEIAETGTTIAVETEEPQPKISGATEPGEPFPEREVTRDSPPVASTEVPQDSDALGSELD